MPRLPPEMNIVLPLRLIDRGIHHVRVASGLVVPNPQGASMTRKLVAVAVPAFAVAAVPAHAGATKTVAVKNNSFSPTSVSIHKGDKVSFKWTQGGCRTT